MQKHKNNRELMQAYRNGYMMPERSGNYWTKDEVKHLSDLFFDGFGISSIALELQRTEVAVFQQLMYQGFIKSYGVRRNRGRNKVKCLCNKCDLQEHCPKCSTCQKER